MASLTTDLEVSSNSLEETEAKLKKESGVAEERRKLVSSLIDDKEGLKKHVSDL